MTATPDLLLVPRRPALLQGHDNALDVLVRLRAPPKPGGEERPPLNIAIVLDRSGSMGGRPLTEAKRAAAAMIDGLTPRDRAALVVYDNQIDVLVPSTPVTDPGRFRSALSSINSGGCTALHGGWLSGAEQASAHLSAGISRVLLLSDGQANHGLTDASEISKQCAHLAEAGVSTSTYGLATSFNEELMVAMANAGGGNSYYGQTADDLMDPFREEFDLLSAMCARRVRLHLSAAPGCRVEVRNGYERDSAAWKLPDLAYEGEAWALVRITVPAGSISETTTLLEARAEMVDLDGAPLHAGPSRLVLPSLPAGAFSAVAEDDLVARRAQELDAAKLQEEARQAANEGDWGRVDGLLVQARHAAPKNRWVQESLGILEGYARRREQQAFSKEAYFKSQKMRRRLSSQREGRWSSDEEAPSYLRRKREQGRDEQRDKS